MLSSSFRLPAASGTARRETNAPAVPCNSSAHRGSVHACGAQRPVASGIACNVPSLVSRTSVVTHAATLDRPSSAASGSGQKPVKQPLKVLIAGAGISGLALALALIKKGVEVTVFERDLTAIRGEGKYRGPIQVQSNALAALEAIDEQAAAEIMREGCITGDRINGLCDGVTGEWYVKFDTFHLAVDRGMPVTRVISRFTLQRILMAAIERIGGRGVVQGNSHVVAFEEQAEGGAAGRGSVSVTLEDGRVVHGDMLVGADGIWSKIRTALVGETPASYSGYTCYTGISDFTPPDIELVGYRVFLGNGKYFVSSDVGGGKMQWYGFHKEPAGGEDAAGTRKARLLDIFGSWNDNVTDLIKATPEDDVLRRDIYDRPPIFNWSKGLVALLGDSAHAMQPNLGQGGCMAIEDSFQLALDMSAALDAASGDKTAVDLRALLRDFTQKRVYRVSAIHGMAGLAAIMASTYKAYLGEGLGPLEFITQAKIPHPGRVAGQVMMKATMPGVLDWVLGGYLSSLHEARVPACRLEDKPHGFDHAHFDTYMTDDDALVAATNANWMLVCERPGQGADGAAASTSSSLLKGIYIGETPARVGRCGAEGVHLSVAGDATTVAEQHATVYKKDGAYCVEDCGSSSGTWVNGTRLQPNARQALRPGDLVEFGAHPAAEVFKVKMQHVTLKTDLLHGAEFRHLVVGQKASAQPDVAMQYSLL